VKKFSINLIILIFESFAILVVASIIAGTALGKSGIGTLIAGFTALFITFYFFHAFKMLLNIPKFTKMKKYEESDETIPINIKIE